MAVKFRIRAEADLTEIADFIAKDNPARAKSFVNDLIDRCLRIDDDKFAPRLRPEIGEGVRLVVYGRYLVLYRVDDADTIVLRVVHGARDLGRVEL